MKYQLNKILPMQLSENLKWNKLSSELDLYSNFFSLDIIRIYSNINILPEDFFTIEEKILDKNMLFYPEKTFSIIRCLVFSFNNKGSYFKKNLKEQFFFLSKYYCYIYLWKQINNIFYIYLNESEKYFLYFLHLVPLKNPNGFFLNFKTSETIKNLDFSIELFYFFKKNSFLNQIISYQLNKHNFQIEDLLYLFIFFNSETKNYYGLFKYSSLFLLIYHIIFKFKSRIRITINAKIKYMLKHNSLIGGYNEKNNFLSYKNILKSHPEKSTQNIINLKFKKKREFISDNFRIYLFKCRENTIQSYSEFLNYKSKIIENTKSNVHHILKKKTIINLSNYYKNKFLERNTIYLNNISNF
nr:hypothetical protein Cry52Nrm1_p090 [Cryptomonas curvata]